MFENLTFPIVFLVIGGLLLILGIVGNVTYKELALGITSGPVRTLSSIIGLLLMVSSGFLFNAEKITESKQIVNKDGQSATQTSPTNIISRLTATQTEPDDLKIIIKDKQKAHVKTSTGEERGECFTEEDFANFQQEKIIDKIKDALRGDNHFLETVIAIQKMPPPERQKFLTLCATIARPAWSTLGSKFDRKSGEGQTKAGHEAEKNIAESIVGLVKEIAKLPESEIKKMYQ